MENFEKLFKESVEQEKHSEKGDIVKGVITYMQARIAFVDLGGKADGSIDLEELKDTQGNLLFNSGDTIEAEVVSYSASGIKLSRKGINQKLKLDEVKKCMDAKTPVSVRVTGKTQKGDYKGIIFNDIQVFISASQFEEGANPLNTTIKAVVSRMDTESNFIQMSLKAYQHVVREQERAELFGKVKVGDIIDSTVKSIEVFGIIVSLGQVDALLHRSNVSYAKVDDLHTIAKVGGKLKVKVIGVDLEKMKIEVGLKQMESDPWDNVKSKYSVGQTVSVTVVASRRKDFICEVETGVEAMLSFEELSWVSSDSRKIKVGDKLDVKISEIDETNRKMSISVRALQTNPWEDILKNIEINSVVKGKILNKTDFGMFVSVYNGIDGLVHKADLSWSGNSDEVMAKYNVGDEIEVKILNIDIEAKRVSLGVKQLSGNPWSLLRKAKTNREVVEVEVIGTLQDKLRVKFDTLEGFVHSSHLGQEKKFDEYVAGEKIRCVVLRENKSENQVEFSIKNYDSQLERQSAREYMKNAQKQADNGSFGNIFKDLLGNK